MKLICGCISTDVGRSVGGEKDRFGTEGSVVDVLRGIGEDDRLIPGLFVRVPVGILFGQG